MRTAYLLWNCIALIQLWRGLFLRTTCPIAPTLCHLLQLNPPPLCSRICQQEMATKLRAPFVHEDPTCAILMWKGTHPRFWMSGFEVCTIIDKNALLWRSARGILCYILRNTWSHRAISLSDILTPQMWRKKAHTVHELTAHPNALEVSQNLGENY